MAFDLPSLDAPFTGLAAYDWGGDVLPLATIDKATIAAHADQELRAELEKRLGSIITGRTSRAAKDYACRKLMIIGTATSVPALAALLGEENGSHMARFALERIDAPAAADALRKACGEVQGDLQIGMISSLASRGDVASVPLLTKLLFSVAKVAVAAAEALGAIGTPEALAALRSVGQETVDCLGHAVDDAKLACAERLLVAGKRAEAKAVYQGLAEAARGKAASKHIEVAATRGILACLDMSTPAG